MLGEGKFACLKWFDIFVDQFVGHHLISHPVQVVNHQVIEWRYLMSMVIHSLSSSPLSWIMYLGLCSFIYVVLTAV